MVYDLISCDDPRLLQKLEQFDFSNPPTDPVKLALDLIESMKAGRGIGLSANQVGLPYRVFVMFGDPPFVCYNPKIVDVSNEVISLREGCLSYPGVDIPVKRPAHVRVRFTTPTGETVTKKFTGMSARVFQHEYDHLEGITFLSRANQAHKDRAHRQLKKFKRQIKSQERLDSYERKNIEV